MAKQTRFPQLARNLKPFINARYGKGKHAFQLAADLGVDVRTAHRWINGETAIGLDQLARLFGVTESRLLRQPLPAVEAYISGPGKGLPGDVKQALLDLQSSYFETDTPEDEKIRDVADDLEFSYWKRRNRP